MALPIAKAADLAKDMAKKGIAGKISMGEPKDDVGSSGSEMDEAPEKDAADHDMEAIAGDILSCIDKGDKAGLAKFLQEMCERCAPGEEMEGPPSLE
jgi:hypothetical protein